MLPPDALGSVRQLADANANVTLTRSYAPYGDTLTSTGTGTTAWQFAGEMRDASGLTFLRTMIGGAIRREMKNNGCVEFNGSTVFYLSVF